MSTITTKGQFQKIEAAVNPEIKRLMPSYDYMGSSRAKAQEIMAALTRLHAFIDPQADIVLKPKIDPDSVELIDISTIDAMLDAKFSVWETETHPWVEGDMEFDGSPEGYFEKLSLRQALNISRNNIFPGHWGPIWGKAKALENVENALGI